MFLLVLDKNPVQSARLVPNKIKFKQLLELSQLVCSAGISNVFKPINQGKELQQWILQNKSWVNLFMYELLNWSKENGYKNNLTIDRIDVNGNYEPSNCRWATNVEQANNRTSNHYITYNGKTQSLADWCRELNLDYSIVSNRLNRYHWAVEQAFETPIKKTKERIL